MKKILFLALISTSLFANSFTDYLWVKDFFSDEEVKYLHILADQMNEDALNHSTDLITVQEVANSKQLCRIEDMLCCYPEFHDFVQSRISPYLENLLGERYTPFKDKLNFKWPGGGAFAPHQDNPAFSHFPPDEFMNVMIPIDSATIENGCLYVARNWRRDFSDSPEINQEMLSVGKALLPYIVGGSNHGSIEPVLVEKISWMPLLVSPNDLVIFSSFVPHTSESNQSDGSRRAMFITFNKARDGEFRKAYYEMKRNDPENPLFHFATPTKARGKDLLPGS